MARKIKITIATSSNSCSVQDYDDVSEVIYNRIDGGMGEYHWQVVEGTDLTKVATKVAFVHNSGAKFGEVKIADIESVTINGVAATITNLSLVRDAVAPYFFSVGVGGYTFMKVVELTPTLLTTAFSTVGIELLPASGANTYYQWEMDLVNAGNGSEAFAGGNVFEIKSSTQVLARVDTTLITAAGPVAMTAASVRSSQLQGANGRFQPIATNISLVLNTIGLANFTISNVANGSRVYAEIRYNIKTVRTS